MTIGKSLLGDVALCIFLVIGDFVIFLKVVKMNVRSLARLLPVRSYFFTPAIRLFAAQIQKAELASLLESKSDLYLIDVRTPQETKSDLPPINTATNIPRTTLGNFI
jgi:hypothetical protein